MKQFYLILRDTLENGTRTKGWTDNRERSHAVRIVRDTLWLTIAMNEKSYSLNEVRQRWAISILYTRDACRFKDEDIVAG